MIKTFKTCLFAALIFVSCGNPSDKKNNSKTEETSSVNSQIKLPNRFYKKMKGKIGEDLLITLDLIKRKDSTMKEASLSGYYYYEKIGMPLDIHGTINDSCKFDLTENDSKGNITGVFKGEFINENEIKGVWTNPKTKKEYPFNLTAVAENNIQFDFPYYYNENCKNKNRNIKSTKKDTLTWTDTLCSSIEISLVSLHGAKDDVCKKINNYVEKNILGMSFGEKPSNNMNELLHSVDNLEDLDIEELNYGMAIVSNENNVLCLSVSYWANTGGAHPNGAYYFLNFDTRTGDTISLLDIVLPETIDELVAISKKQFVKENGDIKETGWFFDDGEFKMPGTFSITKGGLLFAYQQYEAGSYAMGMPQFFVPFSQLKGIIKPEYLK